MRVFFNEHVRTNTLTQRMTCLARSQTGERRLLGSNISSQQLRVPTSVPNIWQPELSTRRWQSIVTIRYDVDSPSLAM